MTDPLLGQFVQTQSPDAFKALVDRHSNAVYAQCVRELRDRHLAEDVAQAVFMVLAKKAKSLPANVVLPAWLFKVTRYACANARRSELRRQRHEQEAAMIRELQHQKSDGAAPSDLETVLDSALARLGRADREAVVLRFYDGMTSTEVAEQLGMSPEAAKKKISRAVEKLRGMLGRGGVTTTPALLLSRLESLAVPSAPAHLAQSITSALGSTTANLHCNSIAQGVIQMMKWTRIKLAFATAMIAVMLGAGGILLTSALAQNPPAPQIAKPSTTPPKPIAAAQVDPAGQDAIDRIMIRTTLEHIPQAIRAHDVKLLEPCIAPASDDDTALTKAMLMQNLAYRHLQDAWAAKFTQPVAFRGQSFVMIPVLDGGVEVVLEKALENLNDSDIQISGSTARVPLKFGPLGAVLAKLGLGNLQGYWIQMVSDGVMWKVDLNKTIHITSSMVFAKGRLPASSDEELKIAVTQTNGASQILQATAQDIESGKLATAQAAALQVETQMKAVNSKYGIMGIGYGSAPARPVSYETGN